MQHFIKKIEISENDNKILSISSFKANWIETTDSQITTIGSYTYKYDTCGENQSDIHFFDSNEEIAIKLFENNDYWFELFNISDELYNENLYLIKLLFPKYQLNNQVFSASYRSNNYVGILNLEVFNILNNFIEVESRKINYKEEFSKLLEILAEEALDLISRDTSFHQDMISKSSDINKEVKDLYSSFAYIKGFLSFDKMPLYLSYLMNQPHKITETYIQEKDIWEIDNIDTDELLSAYSDESNLMKLDKTTSGLVVDKIPMSLMDKSYYETTDNFENCFVKHTLELVYNYLYNIDTKDLSKKFKWEINQALLLVSQYLDTKFFKELSTLRQFSLNSKVLQRKYPYNKFLKFYFSLDMASSVVLDLLDDKVCMGQKDVPKMYEYYCFIKLIKVFDSDVRYKRESLFGNMIKYNKKSLNFTLKNSEESMIAYNIKEDYFLKLYYNKEYKSENYIFAGRSYSHELKPDISIELFWKENLIGILHFDPKYKLDDEGVFKLEDIDKMHTYKDAIMGTIAAYVLYPGTEEKRFNQEEKDFEDKNGLASVGACPLSISSDSNTQEIEYIFKIIEQFINLSDNYKGGVFTCSPVKYNGIERIIGKKREVIIK